MDNKDLFQGMASRYDTEERVRNAKIISDEIRGELRDSGDKIALDYGCGTGLVGLALASMFQNILLVDTSELMIEQVELKIKKMGIKNADTLCCDFMERIPAGITADIVILSQVLLHIKDYRALLKRLYDLLPLSGELLVIDYDRNENISDDRIHSGFVQSDLAKYLREVGFSSVNSRTFYYGKKIFMKKDASLFLLHAVK